MSNEWWRARRQRLVRDFGGRCIGCGAESDLEFAHVRATDLNGRGRGQNHRVRDVLNNPAAYVLLKADKDAPFGVVESIMKELQSQNANRFNIVTEAKKKGKVAPAAAK